MKISCFKMIILEKFTSTPNCVKTRLGIIGLCGYTIFPPYSNRIEIISTVALSNLTRLFIPPQYKVCILTEINSVLNLNSTTYLIDFNNLSSVNF